MPHRPPIVLVVDEDPKLSRQIARIVPQLAEVVHERELARVTILLQSNAQLAAIVVGSPAGGASPLDVLSEVKVKRPSARRLLLVEPGDLSVSIAALHDGTVDHILTRPVHAQEVLSVLTAIINPRPVPAVVVEQALSPIARSA
jgi:two-component system response regulator RegA